MRDPSIFSLLLDLIKRFSILGVGAIVLVVIMSYHPDAAQDHLEAVLANKQQAIVTKAEHSLMFTGSDEASISHQDPANTDAPPTPPAKQNGLLQSLWGRLPWNHGPQSNKAAIAIDSLISSDLRKSTTSVPMAFKPKALFVKVKVNDSVHGHFILDTGATYTTISRRMAEELGLDLRNTPKISITTANGELEVPKVRLRTVNVNNIQAKNVEATVMDFEEDSAFSGLLGLSFIQHFKLTLDPENGQMVFEPIR